MKKNQTVFSIEWHEKGLANSKEYLKHLGQEKIRAEYNYNRLLSDIIFTDFQIVEAKKEGKESFDSDKYKKKFRRN